MIEAGILAAADFDLIEKRIKEVVDEAVEFADKSPKPVIHRSSSARPSNFVCS